MRSAYMQMCPACGFSPRGDAVAAERRIKGWSRRNKRALIDGDRLRLKRAAKEDFKRKG